MIHYSMLWKALLLLFLYLLTTNSYVGSAPSFSCTNFPRQEYDALHDLYTSTRGNNWFWQKNYTMYGIPWNFTTASNSAIVNNPCSQRWQGISCQSLPLSTCTVVSITLSSNNLVGTLPESISTISNLTSLTINHNLRLKGKIPRSIGNLSELIYLDFRANSHTGNMPLSLSSLSKLQSLYIQQNYLTGSIPNDIGGMKSIITFDIRSNGITGSLPMSILQMTQIQSLLIYINQLTGTIPINIGNALKQMVFFDVRSNLFSGPLPESMCLMKNLTDLFAYNNMLTGTLPENIQEMSALELLVLDSNFVSGTIPIGFFSMSQMVIVSIYHNLISGTLPNSLSSMKMIGELSLNDNYMTGNLPTMMSNLYHLSELRLDSNYFYGPIPNFFMTSPVLSIFNVSDNFVSGTIPNTFSYAKQVETIDVSHNFMTGEIMDSTFSSLPILNQLVLRSNELVGNINGLVNASAQPYLTLIDISDNSFSGSLPEEIFFIRNLTSFVAAKNCFTGSLPDNICLPRLSLVNLILDGLHTASSCQHPIFSGVSKRTYALSNPLQGTVPSCLLEKMKVLNTLHLGGNGILGTIPPIGAVSSSLRSLSLSHNRLTGTIPTAIQNYPHWLNLDLSFNRFRGTISKNIYCGNCSDSTIANSVGNTSVSLSLNVNRLSGVIPAHLLSMTHINILQGNMFTCKEFGKTNQEGVSTELPQNDNYASSYNCGSNNLNGVLYSWLVLFFCLSVLIVLIFSASRFADYSFMNSLNATSKRMKGWYQAAIEMKSPNHEINNDGDENRQEGNSLPRRIYEYALLLREVRRWSLALGIVLFVTALPLYSSLSLHYGTFAHQYAYAFSIGFLGGKLPAYVMLVYLSVLIIAVYLDAFAYILPCNLSRIKNAFVSQLVKENAITDRESLLMFEQKSAPTSAAPSPATSTGSLIEFSGGQNPSNSMFSSIQEKFDSIMKDIRSFYEYYILTTFLLLINVLLVVGINMAYVYAIAQDIPASAKQFITILLSIYKLVWNNLVVGNLRQTMYDKLQSYLGKVEMDSILYSRRNIIRKQIWIMPCMLWLSLFNNIIAPFLAVAFISVDCFYYAITPSPSETVSVSFQECEQQVVLTTNNTILSSNVCNTDVFSQYTINYEPPFTYSYQCSSTLLVNFADIFVIRFLISGLIIPVVMFLVKYVQESAYVRYGAENLLYQLCTIILPPMVRPLTHGDTIGAAEVPSPSSAASPSLEQSDESNQRPTSQRYSQYHGRRSSVAESIHDRFSKSLEWMYSGKVRLKIVDSTIVIATDVAVMLTFGTVFPPLAVIGCITLLIRTYLEHLAIGRLYSLSLVQHKLLNVIKALNDECQGVSQLLITGLSSLALIVTLFWACFLFDIHGDEAGFRESIWILPLLPIIALLLPFVDRILGVVFPKKAENGESADLSNIGQEEKLDFDDISGHKIEMLLTREPTSNPLNQANLVSKE